MIETNERTYQEEGVPKIKNCLKRINRFVDQSAPRCIIASEVYVLLKLCRAYMGSSMGREESLQETREARTYCGLCVLCGNDKTGLDGDDDKYCSLCVTQIDVMNNKTLNEGE